jgi:hypothetical protein
MHVVKLLHKLLDKTCQAVDKRVRRTLFEAAETLTRCKHLSIFGLERSLDRATNVKHTIKCIDRLFGNQTLHTKSMLFYQGMTDLFLRGNKRPIIIVDWSGLTRCGAFHFLRASVPVGGRTLTLYEQAYPLDEYTSQKTHREFLNTLKILLPKDCQPIVITDAGFRNTWFKAVLELDWNFIGRIRNKTQYCEINEKIWNPIKTLYEEATEKVRYIGRVLLAKSNSLLCHFYLMKQKKKNRVKRNLAGKKIQSSVSKKHEKGANEPWLIASSLSPDEISAVEIMLLYRKRMQIEEAFRDLKNTRNGLGLRHCRSYRLERLNVALLIGALATLILWLLGTAAKQKNLHYSFQANTEKRWNVLSNFTIGWQVLERGTIKFTPKELAEAFENIVASAIWRPTC